MTEDEFVKQFPAFPSGQYKLGMTLRDYFAAKAMQGMVTDPSWQGGTCKTVASVAYEMADAMLKAREA
jgi:hypothetical protein